MTSVAVQDAIEPLVRMLAADGYRLVVREESTERLELAVEAGTDACADCLVPKDVFVAVAQRHLGDHGIAAIVDVTYP